MTRFSERPIVVPWNRWMWNGKHWVYHHDALPPLTMMDDSRRCPPNVWAAAAVAAWGEHRMPSLWWQFDAPYTLQHDPSTSAWDVWVRSSWYATIFPDQTHHRIRIVAPSLAQETTIPPPDLVWAAWMTGAYPPPCTCKVSFVGLPHLFVYTLTTFYTGTSDPSSLPETIASWSIRIQAVQEHPPVWEQAGADIVTWFWSCLTLTAP